MYFLQCSAFSRVLALTFESSSWSVMRRVSSASCGTSFGRQSQVSEVSTLFLLTNMFLLTIRVKGVEKKIEGS